MADWEWMMGLSQKGGEYGIGRSLFGTGIVFTKITKRGVLQKKKKVRELRRTCNARWALMMVLAGDCNNIRLW